MMALNRPYIRASVKAEVERRAEKNEKVQLQEANNRQPNEGKNA